MIDIQTDCVRRDGVTFVQAALTNARSTPQLVTLESALDGPVWAPTSGPLVDPHWEDERWKGVVPAGSTRGVGFATPADPEDPAAEVRAVRRATRDDDEATDAESVLAGLEPSAPPVDALPGER